MLGETVDIVRTPLSYPTMPIPSLRQPATFARVVALAVLAAGLSATHIARAQDVPVPPEDRAQPVADPPGRVGRLTALLGTVSFEPASDTEWGAAEPNRPVTTGDRLWSDTAGRAEIEMGTAAVRVWHETELDVTRLDDNSLQLRIPQGAVTVQLSTLTSGETAEIDAPNAAVTLNATGEYRVEVSPDGATTTVTVRSGSAEVTSAGSSFALVAHQVATVQGDSAPTYNVAEEGQPDDFDQWVNSRDEVADGAPRRYVPADMPGVEDLDNNGSWDNDADYGPVWYPTTVEAGWAPYHTGHWAWIGPWGWTWVDDASWGWAPFHYGRWAYVHDRWGWCPGRVIAPAVYAPGLVVFAGGAGWGASAAFGPGGGVGWFPLGPEEVYRPAYHVSDAVRPPREHHQRHEHHRHQQCQRDERDVSQSRCAERIHGGSAAVVHLSGACGARGGATATRPDPVRGDRGYGAGGRADAREPDRRRRRPARSRVHRWMSRAGPSWRCMLRHPGPYHSQRKSTRWRPPAASRWPRRSSRRSGTPRQFRVGSHRVRRSCDPRQRSPRKARRSGPRGRDCRRRIRRFRLASSRVP